MIVILFLFLVVAVSSQDDPVPDLFLSSSDDGTASAIIDTFVSLIDFIRCGRDGCPKSSDDAVPVLEVSNGGGPPEENAELCTVVSYRVTKQHAKVLGQDGSKFESDVFGRSAAGQIYLVYTMDMTFFQSDANPFPTLEKRFPLGSTIECAPEVSRINTGTTTEK